VQPEEAARFTMADLVEASGLTERTIRYYVQEGLVSPAQGRGRTRYYTPQHLEELTRVADLRRRHLSIDEIRDLVGRSQSTSTAATGLPSETWERIYLHPDLELLVRARAPENIRALAQDLHQRAQEWFGEDIF
jgi:DNA-binding transcriptional MerR regulator